MPILLLKIKLLLQTKWTMTMIRALWYCIIIFCNTALVKPQAPATDWRSRLTWDLQSSWFLLSNPARRYQNVASSIYKVNLHENTSKQAASCEKFRFRSWSNTQHAARGTRQTSNFCGHVCMTLWNLRKLGKWKPSGRNWFCLVAVAGFKRLWENRNLVHWHLRWLERRKKSR